MTRHRAILGAAGCGKTYQIRRLKRAVLTSTTGVSAVNIGDGAQTIHSLFHFHNRETLDYQITSGRMQKSLRNFDDHTLVLDETSMMPAYAFDAIVQACDDEGVDITVTGDFCQLPPIPDLDLTDPKGKRHLPVGYAFEGTSWPRFEVELLTENHRQLDPAFLAALQSLRAGQPETNIFQPCFENELDMDFPGTTIFHTNLLVNTFNKRRFDRLEGYPRTFAPRRHDQQHPDWVTIEPVTIKIGARVMVIHNIADAVNGDMGTVIEMIDDNVTVKLTRTGDVVQVPYVIKHWYKPGVEAEALAAFEDIVDVMGNENPQTLAMAMQARNDILDAGRLGRIAFMPLRLAYALTVHKTQGLTLDRAQVYLRESSMRAPALVYVALSRVRAVEDLRLIGSPMLLRQKCMTDPKVLPYV